jgi:hypothetical protein
MNRHWLARPAAWALLTCAAFSTARVQAEAAPTARVLGLSAEGAWLDADKSHLSIARALPEPLKDASAGNEEDATRLVLVGFGANPGSIALATRRADGSSLDALPSVTLSPWACPPSNASGPCWATLPLRLTIDRLDRDYPAAKGRALEAALGGELLVAREGRVLERFRVGGPMSPAFSAYERLRAKLRVRILRVSPGGAPAIGRDAGSASGRARADVAAGGRRWPNGAIDLAGPKGPDVEVVDPPPSALIAVGCDAGLPASGGQISLEAAGRRIRVSTRPGDTPAVVAERLAQALRGAGLRVVLSPNHRTSAGVAGTVDVLVRNARGDLVSIAPLPKLALSSDATLEVCLGEVDLENGLTHFVESDAAAGTVEERALVKAFDDGDPSTIDVFIVPSFDQAGRIGESFIDDDGSAIQNTVIIDRAAVRAGPRSYALAHELGHIFLDMPGHPDDYGVDQSSSLMDADAADASVFGPRRLSLSDCERALRESGPGAKIPLLESWPLAERRSPALPATSAR